MSSPVLQAARKYVKSTKKDWNYITPTEFFENYFAKKKRNYVLIDLRKEDAFRSFHVPRAVNIFWLNLFTNKNLTRLRKWLRQGKKLFLICYVGHTSSQAMTLLKLLDIPVTSIKYGYGSSPVLGVPIAGWMQFNYPLIH